MPGWFAGAKSVFNRDMVSLEHRRLWMLPTEMKLYHTGQHSVLGMDGGVATFIYWTSDGYEVLYVGSLT